MARLIFPDHSTITALDEIQPRLQRLGVHLRYWPTPEDAAMRALLECPALSDAEKDTLLTAVDHRFDLLKKELGYTTRDMIVLHPDIPNLAALLAKFEKIHYHTDDEVRYVLAGRGYFGFVEPEGTQFLVEVSAGDYINVPARVEHWFTLRDSTRIKAVRYFIDTSGWTPVYTEKTITFTS